MSYFSKHADNEETCNMNAAEKALADQIYENTSRFASDLYTGKEAYTREKCLRLGEMGVGIQRRAKEKRSHLLSHYYLRPEHHEIADKLGDSLSLSRHALEVGAERVEFQAVRFMADTAKIITGNRTKIYVGGSAKELGCSLVSGTDHAWIQAWKKKTNGTVISYINSDVYLKSFSDYICTSRNTDKIIIHAVKTDLKNGRLRPILVCPDKFLGWVMKNKALEQLEKEGIEINPELIQIYDRPFNGSKACCYIHEDLGDDAIIEAMEEHPRAIVMAHPECGCTNSCMYDLRRGKIPYGERYYSTEQMINFAINSEAKEFVIATETGHVYALRKRLPEKTFYPVSVKAHCDYMKANNFEKLLRSLREDRIEVILCNDDCQECIDPRYPYEDEKVAHIPSYLAYQAKQGIDLGLSIQ